MTGFIFFILAIVAIADVAAWFIAKNSPAGSPKILLLVLTVPQAAVAIFIVLRIAIALISGARL